MVKKIVGPLMAALMMFAQSGLAFAETAPAEKTPSGETGKPAKAMRVMRLTGEVVSVDQKAETVTVKRAVRNQSRELTFSVEKGAGAALSDLKPGDKVTVTYTRAGRQLLAKSIAKTDKPLAKK